MSLARDLLVTDGERTLDPAYSSIILTSEMLADFEIDPEVEFTKTLGYLKKWRLQSKLKTIQADIEKAETGKDGVAVQVLLAEFSELSKKISEL